MELPVKLLVYRAISQNDVLTDMSEKLGDALRDWGVDTTLLELDGPDWPQAIVQAIQTAEIDYVVGFGSFSADLVTPDGRSIFDILGCGLVGWDFDHPAYQYRRFASSIPKRVQIGASASHFRFARMLGCGVESCLMLPGVEVTKAPTPIEDRAVSLTVAMSWLGEPVVWWSEWKGTPAYALIDGVVSRMLADPEADLTRAFEETRVETGLDLPLDENLCNILARAALFVRQYDRIRIADWLASAEIPAVIYGRKWRERLGTRTHITHEDDLPYARLAEVYGRSRAVLNLNAANGGSERAMRGMAAGALVVSDFSPLLEAEFGAAGAVRFFDRRDPSTIENALGSAERAGQSAADTALDMVEIAHTWRHKARKLLDVLEAESLQA